MITPMLSHKSVQTFLKNKGFYTSSIDGLFYDKSYTAARKYLKANHDRYSVKWSDLRVRHAVEQAMFNSAGIPTDVDGLVGPNTLNSLERYQNHLVEMDAEVPRGAAGSSKWPTQSQSALKSFFGEVGSRQVRCEVPYTMVLAWDTSHKLTRFSCHELVKEPLERIFKAALDHYGINAIRQMGLDKFGGCLNVRPKRGGSTYSTHAWGISVDLDPLRNQFRWGRDKAYMATMQFDTWWEIVESEGFVSLGRERNFDWMHFQAARL